MSLRWIGAAFQWRRPIGISRQAIQCDETARKAIGLERDFVRAFGPERAPVACERVLHARGFHLIECWRRQAEGACQRSDSPRATAPDCVSERPFGAEVTCRQTARRSGAAWLETCPFVCYHYRPLIPDGAGAPPASRNRSTADCRAQIAPHATAPGNRKHTHTQSRDLSFEPSPPS